MINGNFDKISLKKPGNNLWKFSRSWRRLQV